jgi:sarcosine oxidase subunit beta
MQKDVVIIGGGVIGASIAYYLSKMGITNVAVIEKSYISSGATGRCGGGIRQQWTSPENVKLAMESVKLFESFKDELNMDIEFYQGGYLLLAYTDEEVQRFKDQIKMQKSLGLDVNLLTPNEALKIVPDLNLNELKAAAFCPTDGHANPFLVNFAYIKKAQEFGVEVFRNTKVIDIIVNNGKIEKVITDKMEIQTSIVINAAGGWASEISEMVGIKLPILPYRHQILITEPVEHFLDPLVMSFAKNIYFRQTQHGSIIMGESNYDEVVGYNHRASWQFLESISKKITFFLPKLKDLSIVRQWSGLYATTPDALPIIDEFNEVSKFIVAGGYSGHGFMLAPITGKLVAEMIKFSKPISLNIDQLKFKRFLDSKNISSEKNVV